MKWKGTSQVTSQQLGGWGNDRPKKGEGDLEKMPFIYLLKIYYEALNLGKSHIDTTVELRKCINILPNKEYSALGVFRSFSYWKWSILYSFLVFKDGCISKNHLACSQMSMNTYLFINYSISSIFETLSNPVLPPNILYIDILPSLAVMKSIWNIRALDPGVSPHCQWGACTGWDFPTRIGECHDQRHDNESQGTVWRPVVGTNNDESQGVSSLCVGFYFLLT